MKERINVNYIGVVSVESDNRVIFKQKPIENSHQELIEKLDDMVNNENRTVLDMQVYFEESFPKNTSLRGYNYCYPYEYCTSYVGGAGYPKLYSYSEYQEVFKELDENAKKNKAKTLKNSFASDCNRYIQAYCYNKQLSILKSKETYKMFSTETIGWTNYSYRINEDIEIHLSTNFGFGSASYFVVGLTYKGIEILPYSMVVNYYYAEMKDIMRYTRKYLVERDSWNTALNFVASTANDAKLNPEKFVSKWIINEIEEMLSGLRRLAINPAGYIKKIMNIEPQHNLLLVKNISNYDMNRYKVYPHEMEIAKQAEKVSGAMMLLEKLKALEAIYPKVLKAIDEIKEIASGLLPSFENKVSQIKNQVGQKQCELNFMQNKKESIELECKPDFDEITRMTELRKKEVGKYVAEYILREEYEKNHPEFKLKYKRIRELKDEISKIQSDICARHGFSDKISDCINIITSKLQLTA